MDERIEVGSDYYYLTSMESPWEEQVLSAAAYVKEYNHNNYVRDSLAAWVKSPPKRNEIRKCPICSGLFKVNDKPGLQKFCSDLCRSKNYVEVRRAREKITKRKHSKPGVSHHKKKPRDLYEEL